MVPSPSRRTVIAGGAAAMLARAADAVEPAPTVGGWREALVVVADPAPLIETLTVVGGWEVAHRGRPDRSLNAFWRLPAGAATEQVLMRNRGDSTGCIRLVRVSGAAQRPIRFDDQPWETGGIGALDVRVVDLASTRAALSARGWRAPSEPVRYEAYPGVTVLQWTPVSPDGVRLSFIQRLAPPLTGWPTLRRWSRVANAAIITGDMATASAFFGGMLGMAVGGRSRAIGTAGANVMGLPWAFQSHVSTEITGFRPAGTDSAVELIAMPEVRGRDHAADARPPNLGIAGLRFVVPDARGLAATLAASAVAIVSPLQRVVVQPYGEGLGFAVLAPDGVWIEFLEFAPRV